MKKIYVTVLTLFIGLSAFCQVTTSSMSGSISDNENLPLIGATIQAEHLPSGTFYGSATNETGKFVIPNMRIGGPYKVVISYIGFEEEVISDIYLKLGEKFTINRQLKPQGQVLQEVVIASNKGVVDKDKTGASTNISREMLNNLPTISRSASDFTRLNPMSAEGGSFGGRNDQFNNYSVNGSIFNNPFGLDAATPGGQTDAQPISLDAIEQIQVSIAPFDVTQSGFTGAAVNAVTKSGTNNFEGTVYGFFRNSNMQGSKVAGTSVNTGDLNQSQFGFAVGGPIIKNKVFFFANFERENRSDLGSYFLPAGAGATGSNVSRVLESDMNLVAKLLKDRYSYDVGAIKDFKHSANNSKGLVKLDFNISQDHKFSLSYNFLDAFKDKPAHPSAIGRRGPDQLTLQFQNSGYKINNVIHSVIGELKSVFGKNISNKFQAGFTGFRDTRDPFSTPFPVLNIGKNGSRYIIAGHEPFSINNNLNQNVIQIQNNLNYFKGNHNITLGLAFEKFDFDNSFNLTGYGARVFFPDVDMAGFETFIKSGGFDAEVTGAKATFEKNTKDDSWALAETNLGQFSAYIQDEYSINKNLTVTGGLRIDLPLYFDTKTKIEENIARNGGNVSSGGVYAPNVTYYDEGGKPVKFDHTQLPNQTPLINPRLGFNYSNDNNDLQVRGGSGLFSGRMPFVWIGNQVANPAFFFYCMTDPNFKFPQVWKNSLGLDKQLKNGWSTTIDLIYTKDLQAQMVRNYGLISPGGRLSGVDSRPIYRAQDRAQGPFGGSTNAYVFGNTNVGHSFNASLQIQKSWKDANFMIAYNFLDARDAASIDAEISSDAFDRNPANISNTNVPQLAPSLYGNRNRILASGSKKFNFFGENNSTIISLFTEYVQGGRYSYTYAGDINNDGSSLNDLIYIPTDGQIDQMNFGTTNAPSQRTAFRQYIAQDKYLSANRGKYAEKYATLAPWYNHWDIRILQDLGISKNGNKFQLSIDILNAGNLISSNWGVREFASLTGLAQPISVAVDANGAPTYNFDVSQKSTFINDFSTNSRWQMQVGLRYIFK